MTFREKLLQRDKKIGEELGPMKPWHSTAYHRHFNGYEEKYVLDENGKRHIQRVYTADIYRLELPKVKAALLCLVRLLLCLAAAALAVYAGIAPEECNHLWYINIFQAISLPLLLWTVYGAIVSCGAVNGMKAADRIASKRALKYGVTGALAAMLLEGAFASAFLLTRGISPLVYRLPLMCLLSAVCLLTVLIMERRAPYQTDAAGEAGSQGVIL